MTVKMPARPATSPALVGRFPVSSEVLVLRILYAMAIVALYPALDAWWGALFP
jgi:hypothetical protein